jgi:hypothetical protein
MMTDKASPVAGVMTAEKDAVKALRDAAQTALDVARGFATSEDLLPIGMSQARSSANELVGLLDNFLNTRITSAERILGQN